MGISIDELFGAPRQGRGISIDELFGSSPPDDEFQRLLQSGPAIDQGLLFAGGMDVPAPPGYEPWGGFGGYEGGGITGGVTEPGTAPTDPYAIREERARPQEEPDHGGEEFRNWLKRFKARYSGEPDVIEFLQMLEDQGYRLREAEIEFAQFLKERQERLDEEKRQRSEAERQQREAERDAKRERERAGKETKEEPTEAGAAAEPPAAAEPYQMPDYDRQAGMEFFRPSAGAEPQYGPTISFEELFDEAGQPPQLPAPTGQLEAAGMAVSRQAVPTAGAIAGAKAVALLGAPLGPVGAIVGGLIGGFGGAFLANAAQDRVIKAVKGKEGLDELNAQMAANVREYPLTTLGAEIAPSLAAFRVDITKLRKAVSASRTLLSGGKLAGDDIANLADVTLGAGTEAAVEAVAQYNTGDFDAMRLAAATLAGLAINDARFQKAPPSVKSAVDAQLKQLGDTPVEAAENAASRLQRKVAERREALPEPMPEPVEPPPPPRPEPTPEAATREVEAEIARMAEERRAETPVFGVPEGAGTDAFKTAYKLRLQAVGYSEADAKQVVDSLFSEGLPGQEIESRIAAIEYAERRSRESAELAQRAREDVGVRREAIEERGLPPEPAPAPEPSPTSITIGNQTYVKRGEDWFNQKTNQRVRATRKIEELNNALQEREAAAVPVGERTEGRPPMDREVREQAAPEDKVEGRVEEEVAAPPRRKGKRSPRADVYAGDTPLLQLIERENGVRAKGKDYKGGEYDEAPTVRELGPLAKVVYRKGSKLRADQMAGMAYDEGIIPDGKASTFWEEVRREAKGFKSKKERKAIEEMQQDEGFLEMKMEEEATSQIRQIEAKADDDVGVNAAEMETGDLVYKNGEWFRAKVKSDGVELVDGTVIKLDDFENTGVAGVVKEKDIAYEKALAEYRAQEAAKAKPAAPESKAKPPDLMTPENTKASEYEKGIRGMPAPIVINREKIAKRLGIEWETGAFPREAEALITFDEYYAINATPKTSYGREKKPSLREYLWNIKYRMKAHDPVLASSVDANKLRVPPGYVREGDLYVYKPATAPGAPEAPVTRAEIEALPYSRIRQLAKDAGADPKQVKTRKQAVDYLMQQDDTKSILEQAEERRKTGALSLPDKRVKDTTNQVRSRFGKFVDNLKASTKVGYAYTVKEQKGAAVAERLGKQTHANIEFVYRELKKAGFKAGQLHRDMLAAIRNSGRLVDSKGKVYTSDDIADMGAAKRRTLAEDIGIEVTPDMDGMDIRKELFMRIQPDMTPEQFAEKYRLTDDQKSRWMQNFEDAEKLAKALGIEIEYAGLPGLGDFIGANEQYAIRRYMRNIKKGSFKPSAEARTEAEEMVEQGLLKRIESLAKRATKLGFRNINKYVYEENDATAARIIAPLSAAQREEAAEIRSLFREMRRAIHTLNTVAEGVPGENLKLRWEIVPDPEGAAVISKQIVDDMLKPNFSKDNAAGVPTGSLLRRDLNKVLRKLFGEIDDPAAVAGGSREVQQRLASRYQAVRSITKDLGITTTDPEKARKKGWVKLQSVDRIGVAPTEYDRRRYGVLAGTYAPKAVKSALTNDSWTLDEGLLNEVSDLNEKTLNRLAGMLRGGQVNARPKSWLRDAYTNLLTFAGGSGDLAEPSTYLRHYGDAQKAMLKYLTAQARRDQKGIADGQRFFRMLADRDIHHSGQSSYWGEVQNLINGKGRFSKVWNALGSGRSLFADGAAKYAAYMTRMEIATRPKSKKGFGWSEKKAREWALEAVKEHYDNRDRIPAPIKTMLRQWYAPDYKAFSISAFMARWSQVRHLFRDAGRNDIPLWYKVNSLTSHFASYAAQPLYRASQVGIGAGAANLGLMLKGRDILDDEAEQVEDKELEQAIRYINPPYFQNDALVFFSDKDKEGNKRITQFSLQGSISANPFEDMFYGMITTHGIPFGDSWDPAYDLDMGIAGVLVDYLASSDMPMTVNWMSRLMTGNDFITKPGRDFNQRGAPQALADWVKNAIKGRQLQKKGKETAAEERKRLAYEAFEDLKQRLYDAAAEPFGPVAQAAARSGEFERIEERRREAIGKRTAEGELVPRMKELSFEDFERTRTDQDRVAGSIYPHTMRIYEVSDARDDLRRKAAAIRRYQLKISEESRQEQAELARDDKRELVIQLLDEYMEPWTRNAKTLLGAFDVEDTTRDMAEIMRAAGFYEWQIRHVLGLPEPVSGGGRFGSSLRRLERLGK